MSLFFQKALLIGGVVFTVSSWSACVEKSKANLRKGPGVRYKKSWLVSKYMPFREVSKKGAWRKVIDVDGEDHWVHRSLITKSMSCVVVKSYFAYLRSGPGEKFSKTSTALAEKYTPFKKVGETTYWVQVEDSLKQRHWIFRKHLWEPTKTVHTSF